MLKRSELKISPIVDDWYLLERDLHFKTTIGQIHAISPPYARKAAFDMGCHVDDELFITVPKGFMTDLTSIPKMMDKALPPDGQYAPAAVVHDFLYQMTTGDISTLGGRFQSVLGQFGADRVLLLAMRECGCSEVLSTAFFSAVQLAGGQFYQKPSDAPMLDVELFNFASDYDGVRRKLIQSIPADHYQHPFDKSKRVSVKYPNCLRPFYTSEVSEC